MNRVIIRGLFGAAAGIAMVSGAQAADLPVKAKPVEYVKICSAYGAGFYYIPGTDICLRVGGLVFFETGVKAAGAAPQIYQATQMGADHNYTNYRSRGHVILDARTNTSYGTLRSYADFGVSQTNGATFGNGGAASMNRAFIEFAGFTFGYTVSFFDFGAAQLLSTASLPWQWVNMAAYTANLGNGVTATLALEDNSTRTSISSAAFAGAFIASGTGYGGTGAPNLVGNFNVRQAWGRAQISGAVQQIKPNVALQLANAAVSSEWGYAVSAGIELNTPSVAPGNTWLLQAQYAKGATEYLGLSGGPATPAAVIGHVNNGFGPVFSLTDAEANATGLHLTKGWSAHTAYRHNWTPSLRSTFYAGYSDVEPAAVSNLPSLELWQAGIMTNWSPVSGLNIGVDIMYSDIETGACVGALSTANCSQSDSVWTAWTRITRSF